ncbi:substrate-binding periplasmic protein [Pseudomonas sp. FME51]|uniref:substrate-binding periplasmic protein n=1 Tax=Pseudomonas sp. FME51 TaxID=2742609 RepID=UPI001867A70A|nr:transporter substrate-binding domain-containing protein [Pseudomonas sp. FME51]
MKGTSLRLALLFLFAGDTVLAEQKPEVQVAFMDFPGYSELGATGRATGKAVDLTRKLLHEAGYEAQVQILPAARIWLGLENGDVHMWPGLLNKPGLDEHTLLTERDMGQVGINLYYLPGNPAPDWPQGLRGKSVIMITNFTYTNALKDILIDPELDLVLHKSGSHSGAVKMLLRGRGDYLLDYRAQVDVVRQELELDPLPSIKVAEHPMRFVLSRHSGFADQLKADLDAAFDRLQAQGVELDVTQQ